LPFYGIRFCFSACSLSFSRRNRRFKFRGWPSEAPVSGGGYLLLRDGGVIEHASDEPTATQEACERRGGRRVWLNTKDGQREVTCPPTGEANRRRDAMTKWEYKIVGLPSGESSHLEQELNRLGEDGWESSGFIQEGSQTKALMKRPKKPEPQKKATWGT
jgi:hypothetical protein